MLWSTIFKIRQYNVLLKFQVMKPLNIRTSGISSRVPKANLHTLFLDYDNITDDRLKEELEFLQAEFKLGNFYVLQTREYGRHAICIDALRFAEIKRVIDFSSCDSMFKKAPNINEYRCWILRYGKKGNREGPTYAYTVPSEYEGKNLQSRAHAKYLLLFGIKIDLKNPYGAEEIETQDYNTGQRTHLDEKEKS